MLIEFKLSNFRSFFGSSVFSMEASSIQEFSKSIIRKSDFRILPLNIVYGANASGKTNLFYALEILKNMILTGKTNIGVDLEIKMFGNFWNGGLLKDTNLEIKFLNDENLFEYSVSFFREDGNINNIKISKEIFIINNKEIYRREKNSIEYTRGSKNQIYFNQEIIENFEASKKILNVGLVDNELFISNGVYNLLNRDYLNSFHDWFQDKLNINLEFNNKPLNQIVNGFKIPDDVTLNDDLFSLSKIDSRITKFLKLAEVGDQEFHLKNSNDKNHRNSVLYSKYYKEGVAKYLLPSNVVESQGTLKLIDLIIPVFKTIDSGSVLVIDELDSSIHPSLISAVISIFTNSDINKNNAQLIFNTQNPIYINRNLVRRDEVTFIDKNDIGSEIYSLVDLARNDSDYLKNYLEGQYGAIKYIDLYEIFNGI